MKKKLIQRFITVLVILIVLNVLTLMTTGSSQLLEKAAKDFNANGRLNSGTEVIVRNSIEGVTSGTTIESFGNLDIREFMESFTQNRIARSVIYRPEPVQLSGLEHDEFEISIVVEQEPAWLFTSEITITALRDEIIASKTEHVFWLFGWRRYKSPVFSI